MFSELHGLHLLIIPSTTLLLPLNNLETEGNAILLSPIPLHSLPLAWEKVQSNGLNTRFKIATTRCQLQSTHWPD